MRLQGKLFVLVVLTFILTSTWALSIFGPTEIIMLPEKTRNITLTVENTQLRELTLSINCKSELGVFCQKQILVPRNGTEEFLLEVRTEKIGHFPIFINVGGVEKVLFVRISESPLSLRTILENYNQTINTIESRTGRTKAIALARGIWFNTFMLYNDEKYEKVSEELETLSNHVKMSMEEPPLQLKLLVEDEGELPTAAIPLKSGLIPLGVLLLISGFFFVKKKVNFDEMKQLKMSFTQDLIKVKHDAVVVNNFVREGSKNGKSK